MTLETIDVQRAMGELSVLNRKYSTASKNIELTVRPNLADKLFSKLGLVELRINRLRKSVDLLDSRKEDAFQIIDEILVISGGVRNHLASENAKSIGNSVRFASDLKIIQKQIDAMREACADTLDIVKRYRLHGLPENYLDWSKVRFDEVRPPREMSIVNRTHHQRSWSKLIELINHQKKLILEIKTTNKKCQWTSEYEAICENSFQKFHMERYKLSQKVDWLKSKIAIGEIQEIEGFLDAELNTDIEDEDFIFGENYAFPNTENSTDDAIDVNATEA